MARELFDLVEFDGCFKGKFAERIGAAIADGESFIPLKVKGPNDPQAVTILFKPVLFKLIGKVEAGVQLQVVGHASLLGTVWIIVVAKDGQIVTATGYDDIPATR